MAIQSNILPKIAVSRGFGEGTTRPIDDDASVVVMKVLLGRLNLESIRTSDVP
jgi:hypothetical protein